MLPLNASSTPLESILLYLNVLLSPLVVFQRSYSVCFTIAVQIEPGFAERWPCFISFVSFFFFLCCVCFEFLFCPVSKTGPSNLLSRWWRDFWGVRWWWCRWNNSDVEGLVVCGFFLFTGVIKFWKSDNDSCRKLKVFI